MVAERDRESEERIRYFLGRIKEKNPGVLWKAIEALARRGIQERSIRSSPPSQTRTGVSGRRPPGHEASWETLLRWCHSGLHSAMRVRESGTWCWKQSDEIKRKIIRRD